MIIKITDLKLGDLQIGSTFKLIVLQITQQANGFAQAQKLVSISDQADSHVLLSRIEYRHFVAPRRYLNRC